VNREKLIPSEEDILTAVVEAISSLPGVERCDWSSDTVFIEVEEEDYTQKYELILYPYK
jgi:hypothetical protein